MIYSKYDYSYDSPEKRINAEQIFCDLREKIPFTLAIVEAKKSKPELSDIPF